MIAGAMAFVTLKHDLSHAFVSEVNNITHLV
jgi:hypothetical protein